MRPLLLLFLSTLAFPQEQKPDRVVTITAERFTFSPSKITLKQGQLVEFVLISDDTDHGFKIPSASIDVAIPPQSFLRLERLRSSAPSALPPTDLDQTSGKKVSKNPGTGSGRCFIRPML